MILLASQSVNDLRLTYSASYSPPGASTNVPPSAGTSVSDLTNSPAAFTWE